MFWTNERNTPIIAFTNMEGKLPPCLSAQFKESFAYTTIRDRLPVILAKIADTVCRIKHQIKEQYGQDGQEELKSIAGCISKLRNEVVTSKPIIPLEDTRPDAVIWNEFLKEVTKIDGQSPEWFISPWLYVECYMYRRVQEAVEKCVHLKQLDVFKEQKQQALMDSSQAVLILFNYLMSLVNDMEEDDSLIDKMTLFKEFTQVSLWGNKCDLSISALQSNSQTMCPLSQVDALRQFILIDDLDRVWHKLSSGPPGRVDIILDNAGFELVTDLCLAEFLLSSNLASSVHFHAKAFPWFVSDVTPTDFDYTFQYLMRNNSLAMDIFQKKWKSRLQDGTWKLQVHDFWTLPFAYCDMKKYAPDLYAELADSSLILFKGDLNYRKLTGDRCWPVTTPFKVSLQGFHPAPLCALRALKADIVTGLQEGQAERVQAQDKYFMINGNWSVISYCDVLVPLTT